MTTKYTCSANCFKWLGFASVTLLLMVFLAANPMPVRAANGNPFDFDSSTTIVAYWTLASVSVI